MAKLQKFLFDLDFGAPPPQPVTDSDLILDTDIALDDAEEFEEPPPPPPPTFSEEELALAREQAREAGRQSGLEEAQSSTERLLALSLGTIGDTLKEMGEVQANANEERMKDAVSVALAVVRKLQPEMSRDHALEEIAAVVEECLSHIEKDVRVTIRVNPEHSEAIRDYANRAAEATGFEGKLIYAADNRIVPGDCRVEWGDGGIERDQARLWKEIETTIARALGTEPGEIQPLPPTDAEGDDLGE